MATYSTQQRGIGDDRGKGAGIQPRNATLRTGGRCGARELLRSDLLSAREAVLGRRATRWPQSYDASYQSYVRPRDGVRADSIRKPDAQKEHAGGRPSSNYGAIGENRLLMSLQVLSPIAWPLIYAVTGWACLMFAGMGLLSRPNAATFIMLILGGDFDQRGHLSHSRTQPALRQRNPHLSDRPRSRDRRSRKALRAR